MKFGIHKCAYWGRKFVRGRGEDNLRKINICGEAIPLLEGSETFKYLGEHKARALARTNHKPILPRRPNEDRRKVYEGKRALAKFKAIRSFRLSVTTNTSCGSFGTNFIIGDRIFRTRKRKRESCNADGYNENILITVRIKSSAGSGNCSLTNRHWKDCEY